MTRVLSAVSMGASGWHSSRGIRAQSVKGRVTLGEAAIPRARRAAVISTVATRGMCGRASLLLSMSLPWSSGACSDSNPRAETSRGATAPGRRPKSAAAYADSVEVSAGFEQCGQSPVILQVGKYRS